jgi:glycosyltransferase involved in cell wall biosynthesis
VIRLAASVIVPVRDDRRLDDLLASLEAQRDAPPFEVLVAFDGGRGPGDRFAQRRARALRLPPRGPYAARNAAARDASGELLLFTDSDCLCPPDWVAVAVRAFDDRETAALQGCSTAGARSRLSRWIQDTDDRWVASHAARAYRRICNTRCFAIRRGTFDAAPFPDVHPLGGDGAFGIDLERRGVPIRFDPGWSVVHRHPNSHLEFGRKMFEQARHGVRWRRTHGIDLFGPQSDSSGRSARIVRGTAGSPSLATAASAAAACASAALALATLPLSYRAGRHVFDGFVRAARLAGRLRGEAEAR